MPTQTSRNLRMIFRTAGGKNFTLTIPMPRADVTAAEVETVMDLIVARNILATPNGDLSGKQDIKIVDSTVTDLYDPAQA